MKILALDTSTQYLCVGLYDEGKTSGLVLRTGVNLSRLITVSLGRVMMSCGYEPGDFDYIACGVGPGSFTGVRIGMSCAKALAWSVNTRMVGVKSLDMLALGADTGAQTVCAVMDARRDLVYWSLYARRNGVMVRKRAYALGAVADAIKAAPRGCVFTGDGIERYGATIARLARDPVLLEKDYWYPKPHLLIACALAEAGGKKGESALAIKPVYLYPQDCQVRRPVSSSGSNR